MEIRARERIGNTSISTGSNIKSRFQGDGKTFSGLPMAFYVPKSEIQQIPNYENNYRMTPKKLFNGNLYQ